MQCDSTTGSDSIPGSPDSQASTASYLMCPRLPITYNEVALSKLWGRPKARIFNNLSILLPISSSSDSKSTLDGSEDDDPAAAKLILHPHRMNHWQQFQKAQTPPVVSSRSPQMTPLTRSSWPMTRGTRTRWSIARQMSLQTMKFPVSDTDSFICIDHNALQDHVQSHKTIVIHFHKSSYIITLQDHFSTGSEHCNFCTSIFQCFQDQFFSNRHVTNFKELLILNQGP